MDDSGTANGVKWIQVQQGDCLSSIAAAEGFSWRVIWNHPANARLKEMRQDPNILHPGDRLAIPEKSMEPASCVTDKRHEFELLGSRTWLRLRLLFDDEPRKNVRYVLSVEGQSSDGTTDSDGRIEVRIPASARTGTLWMMDSDPPQKMNLLLGHMDPVDTLAGVQKRLRNMGYFCEVTGELDELTKAAIVSFRARHNLPPGEVDDSLRNSLRSEHLS